MILKDERGTVIEDGSAIVFNNEDSVEPTGFNTYVTVAKLCIWSEEIKKYTPLDELETNGVITDSIVVKNNTPK